MKTPAVKGLFAAAAAVLFAATPHVGQCVTVDVTKFQQRYPWNGLVDIDYTITRSDGELELVPSKHSVEITVVNCDVSPAETNVAHVFRQGALPVSDGAHRVTWDANAEGITFNAQNVKVFAEVVHYAEKYMIIDVTEGSTATVFPVTYMHGAPTDGFNTEEYKGNKIALRLIPPGSFVMGSPTTESGRSAAREAQHAVAITKPFYMGVFEVTQKQYKNVTGKSVTYMATGDYHPAAGVGATYGDIRGNSAGLKWPQTNSVDGTSFMGLLRSKCKEWNADTENYDKDVPGFFDLPTEAQWEYACRAGTTSAYNNGGNAEADLKKLGRYSNSGGGHVNVGSYDPNAWGLYDMHGNVWELCLDRFKDDVQNIANPSIDPVGPDTGSFSVHRGGSFYNGAGSCRSASRYDGAPSRPAGNTDAGFRLARTMP